MSSGAARWSIPFSIFSLLLAGLLHPPLAVAAVTHGYVTALLRSDCTSLFNPPPPGETVIGPDYVIRTVADADPNNFTAAQQLVTDAVFESLMPSFCALSKNSGMGCVTNKVQWQIVTFDTQGHWMISGCAASGCENHYCTPATGYITAVIRGEFAKLPPPPPVGVTAVGTDCVMVTIADGDPDNLTAAQALASDAVFEGLMQSYCALPRGSGPGYVSGRAQWMVATYDSSGNPKQSGCASGDCISHECVVRQGYITACLASRCTSAPKPPGPGQIASGPDYVIMTLADADYRDFANAQRLAPDSIFESLMPLYCALPRTTNDCVTNRVQWSVRTYDAGGNPFISGCASSGCQDHYCGVLHGYVTAVVRGTNATLPPPGAIGVLAVGTDSVMMTLADGDPSDLVAAQQLATDTVFAALMRVYCALPRGGGPGLVSGAAQWVVGNYDANGKPTVSGCASSGCELHTCMVSNGYVTAVLYSGCGAAPEPPQSLGQVAIGPEYVIMTVADADPRDFAKAQQLVPDSIFESLMPLYCSLPQTTNNCLTNRVQWAVRTYDAGGNSLISGCAASGCRFHVWNPGNPSSPALVISPGSGNRVTISWAPRTPGWLLQETGNYRAGPWSNAPTFGANPVTVPASQKRFYRMSKQ